ncbi:MAG: IclR family transcriptional regulator [Jiangellaceae bacterium]
MTTSEVLKTGDGARTLARGLLLLELVADSPPGVGVSELAAKSGLDKGTVSRLLATLRQCGYVRQSPGDRHYSLSAKTTRLSHAYLTQLDLRGVARPFLWRLREEVGETIHLAIREGTRIVYVDQLEPDRAVRHSSAVGQILPLHVTAMGRALLVAMKPVDRDEMLALLLGERRYDDFVGDGDRLFEELADAARRGWATVDRRDDVIRIGAAIVDGLGEPLGAMSISGPSYRIADRMDELGQRCREVAADVGHAFG